jgi:hypothetical protein
MSPWFADPRFGKFANDKSLTQTEIDTIAAWAEAGASRGPAHRRRSPDFPTGLEPSFGTDPDLVIEMPIEWRVVAEGELPNFNLYQPMPFKRGQGRRGHPSAARQRGCHAPYHR